MDNDIKLPPPSTQSLKRRPYNKSFKFLAFLWIVFASSFTFTSLNSRRKIPVSHVPLHAAETLQKCRSLDAKPGPPPNFHLRTISDRFAPGTPPTLLLNATIWTGRDSGFEVVRGDVLLDNGIIRAVGNIQPALLERYRALVKVELNGAWVSPGIVDMHSHLGVDSSPSLKGASDTNSRKGLVLPWLRSLDGLNTHDDAYRLSISGGVTTAVVLPGSADAIGGQAFPIKLRPTAERSPSSMLLEPPYSLNGTVVDPSLPPRWRQMKHACGENPSRVYKGSRMDTIWAFREGYNKARQVKQAQDNYCAKALVGKWDGLGAFPEDLQWEALVDVLRGRVKVHNHCYEAVDLDGLVRLSNEFQFSIAAFHHAHETYLVPDLIKKAYGLTPAIALFATNARYKRESYRGSEFAPRILADHGLRVVMKSDHPVLNSRHLVYEAQQAHFYGLAANLALASVTTTPATVIGQDHRIGYVREGYDADVIVWDSHPLALGATPKQVYIDGIAQLTTPHAVEKPRQFQDVPVTPNFDDEAKAALEYDGLPPLSPKKILDDKIVIFTNVSNVFIRHQHTIRHVFSSTDAPHAGVVIVDNGEVVCASTTTECLTDSEEFASALRVDLKGGTISPSLISYGSDLGLGHIAAETSTNDGPVIDVLTEKIPDILGGDGSLIRAVDGLQFSTRDALLAYRAGVTVGVTAPQSSGFLSGLSTAFGTGHPHRLGKGAVVQDVTAVHVRIKPGTPGVSTQISALRRLLLGYGRGQLADTFHDVAHGRLPLVVHTHSADVMATLIELKQEIEYDHGYPIRLVISGAAEAHLLAKEIGKAKVGIILSPVRPFPGTWSGRRILAGPPHTPDNAIQVLLANNVIVGVGIDEPWEARNQRFDIGWAALEADGHISKAEALALASVNLEKLLGIKALGDLVATQGGEFTGFDGKVIAIISQTRGVVDVL